MDKIIIYTDGGCRGNPGLGGWGAWLRFGKYDKKIKGFKANTTNNQMELLAAIKALEAISSSEIRIDLFTDSKYVMNGINEWIKNWKIRGWKTANKKSVKNVELWKRLDELNQKHQISWHWVKGHSGDEGNEMADLLANQAMDEA
ncbi:MAG: ribonuclease HI [Candidatus Thioglobus sp.]|nr:ribonuclease HI [Candidatus Thioglobus sp.]